MSIESTPVSHSLAKAAQPAAGGKGKATSAVAGDALGFFAMLSAADDALALSAGASGLAEGSGERALSGAGPQGADDLLEADANALAGWVLGVPVPVAQEAVSSGGRPPLRLVGIFPVPGGRRGLWMPRHMPMACCQPLRAKLAKRQLQPTCKKPKMGQHQPCPSGTTWRPASFSMKRWCGCRRLFLRWAWRCGSRPPPALHRSRWVSVVCWSLPPPRRHRRM